MSLSKRLYGVTGYGSGRGAGASKARAEIVGIEQLEDMLENMPKDIDRRKVLASSVRGAIMPTVVARMRRGLAIAGRAYGSAAINLEDQILVKQLAKSKTWRAGYLIGWSLKAANAEYRKWAETDRSRAAWAFRGAMWLEWGASGIGRHTKYTGIQYRPIQPFGWFRRAIDGGIREVERDFRKSMHKTMNRYLNRYYKAYGG